MRSSINRVSRPIRSSRQIFPSVAYVKLPYFTEVWLNTLESATTAEYLFRVNSVFDPDLTSTGAQPRGLDQWLTMYNNWEVMGCKYEVMVSPSSDTSLTSTANNIIVGMTVGPENFAGQNFSSLADYLEYPRSKYHKYRITARSNTAGSLTESATYNDRPQWFKGYISMKQLIKLYGSRNNRGEVSATAGGTALFEYPVDFVGDVSSNPNCEYTMALWAAGLSQDAAGSSLALPYMRALVRLTYYTKLWNPFYPSGS